jgi:RNA polymerase sigma factor (sigma-70 family)
VTTPDPGSPLDDLLEHADWVRGLARRLVLDGARAEDLVQEAWVIALEHPPNQAGNPRAWLGRVVTNLARNSWRSETRRNERERAQARPEAVPSSADLVHEAASSRDLVDALLSLDDPYRSVLLLRYFHDRSPSQIAKQLRRPVATVKTQLQRGLAKLRERLDDKWGGRRVWCAALLPLARGGAVALPSLALPPVLVGVLVLVLALAGVWSFARRLPGDGAMPALDPSAEADPRISSTELVRPDMGAQGSRTPRERARMTDEDPAPASPEDPRPFEFPGRLVNMQGVGISGIQVEWVDPGKLHWVDDDHTLIAGLGTWLHVSRQEQDRLTLDPAALETFARRNARRPDLVVALLRGEEPAPYRTWTGPRGEFGLRVPQSSGRIVSLDPTWGLIGQTRWRGVDEPAIGYVALRRTLSGQVLDATGEPQGDVDVTLRRSLAPPPDSRRTFRSAISKRRADGSGRFEFEGVALGEEFALEALGPEGETASGTFGVAELPEARGVLGVELRLSAAAPPLLHITGRVTTPSGAPSPRTTVVWGPYMCVTNEEGAYQLDVRLLGHGSLFAVRPGFGIAVLPGFEPDLSGMQADLHLPSTSLTIEGRVATTTGEPLAGVKVRLASDTSIPGDPFSLEDLAAGRTRGFTVTNDSGRFRLDGLLNRDYGIVVSHAGQRYESVLFAAGTSGVEITVEGE